MDKKTNGKFILRKFKELLEKIKKEKKYKTMFISSLILIFLSVICVFFISRDEGFYKETIAKITSITKTDKVKTSVDGGGESNGNQLIKAVIMNGPHKGEKIELQNATSESQAYDIKLKVHDEVFVSINKKAGDKITSVDIIDFKRDNYIAYTVILFALLILLIGGIKGFRSLISVVINVIIFFIMIELIFLGHNLLLIAALASVIFIIVSISIVSGFNEKTVSAIVGTLAATIASMLITAIVILATHSNGIHYEEMEYIRPPDIIFYIEILIGTLGAIIDIAISISSAINEIHENSPEISDKDLINSGREIGNDIMGTMANTLVFAYISGGIPMILLLIKNGFSPSYIININLSLEVIRALVGSIGIVISIPITIFTSVLIIKNKRNRGAIKA